MSYDTAVLALAVVIALVFLNELKCARQRYLADIAAQLVTRHADAVVLYCKCTGSLVHTNKNFIVVMTFGLSERAQPLHFCYGVCRVGHDFTQKNILFRVKPSFYNGKYVSGFYRNTALFC